MITGKLTWNEKGEAKKEYDFMQAVVSKASELDLVGYERVIVANMANELTRNR